jgi:geranylgeranyl reductase family protein
MTDADFIVLGAGPAGATAAHGLADKGHSVLLLDKDDFPRDKACGGGLCPHIMDFPYVRETMDDYLESVCTRGMIFSPSLTKSIDHRSETPLFYNIRRKKFDHQLVKFAQEQGAELRKTHVKDVSENNEMVTVTTTDGTELTAKALVGATGPYDPAAKYVRERTGQVPTWKDDEIGTILVHEFPVPRSFIDDAYGEERLAIIHLMTAGLLDGGYGYGWVFSKNDVLNIGYGGFKKDMKLVDRKEVFRKYLGVLRKDGYFPDDVELDKFKGAPLPLKGAIRTTFYNRMLIAGDAAGFVSPISGEGIYYAMDSGRIAANVLHDATMKEGSGGNLGSGSGGTGTGAFSSNALSRYQKEWGNEWGRDLNILKFFANRLMAWPEAIVRYGMKDELLKKYLVGIFISTESADKLKMKIAARVIRNFLMFH